MPSVSSMSASRWVIGAFLVLNGFIAVVVAFFLAESRAQYTEKASISSRNVAQLIEQQVNASLRQIDISLRAMNDAIVLNLAAGKSLTEQKLDGLLTQYRARMPNVDRLLVTNAAGGVIASSGFDSPPDLSVGDRDYFHRVRDDSYAGLVVGRPVIGKSSSRPIIPFARRISNLDGSFAGALIVVVEIDRFAGVLSRVDVGDKGAVSLLDADLNMIASHPAGRIEQPATPTGGILDGMPRVMSRPDGDFTVSLLKSPDWPFHVSVDLPEEDYLASWRQELLFSLAALLVFLLVTAAAAHLMLAAWRARSRTEAELLRALRFNEALLKAIPVPVFFKDRDGRYLGCNQAYSDILGVSREEIMGKTVEEVWPEELAAVYRQKDMEQFANPEPTVYEFAVRDRNGESREVLFAKNTYIDEHGGVAGIIGAFIDITERKRAEREIEEARVAAESASLAKSQFLATMSHEIRTPLNGVLGMAQLILMSECNEDEHHDYARIILNSGETLLALVNDILDVSKVEAGKLVLENVVFDPEQVIQETLALFAEAANQKRLQLEGVCAGLSHGRYRGDAIRLRQMLSNLISNAIKFSEQGGIVVKVMEFANDGEQATLQFEVADCGIGIPPEQQPRLFQPFSQADSSTTRKYGGSGLGLSIVRRLAELMNGTVGVDSEPGRGSRFWFSVNVGVTREGEESRRKGTRRLPAADDSFQTQPAGHILLVDDNPINRKTVESLLSKSGLDVRSVTNGQEAVDAAASDPRPQLVLMDCQMPVLDGYEATQEIRRWEFDQGQTRVPIVALTASVFEEDRQRCLAAGMDDFLAKPVSATDLTATVGKWLGGEA